MVLSDATSLRNATRRALALAIVERDLPRCPAPPASPPSLPRVEVFPPPSPREVVFPPPSPRVASSPPPLSLSPLFNESDGNVTSNHTLGNVTDPRDAALRGDASAADSSFYFLLLLLLLLPLPLANKKIRQRVTSLLGLRKPPIIPVSVGPDSVWPNVFGPIIHRSGGPLRPSEVMIEIPESASASSPASAPDVVIEMLSESASASSPASAPPPERPASPAASPSEASPVDNELEARVKALLADIDSKSGQTSSRTNGLEELRNVIQGLKRVSKETGRNLDTLQLKVLDARLSQLRFFQEMEENLKGN